MHHVLIFAQWPVEQMRESYILSLQYYPNVAENSLTVKAKVQGTGLLEARAFYEGRSCGRGQAAVQGQAAVLTVPLTETHLWEAGKGRLYDLELTFGEDRIKSYFGLREIRIQGEKVLLNGEPVFQRMVLDQGYYPDGIYTAPSEEDLERDIRLAMEAISVPNPPRFTPTKSRQ